MKHPCLERRHVVTSGRQKSMRGCERPCMHAENCGLLQIAPHLLDGLSLFKRFRLQSHKRNTARPQASGNAYRFLLLFTNCATVGCGSKAAIATPGCDIVSMPHNAPGERRPTDEDARNSPKSLRGGPSAPLGCSAWEHSCRSRPFAGFAGDQTDEAICPKNSPAAMRRRASTLHAAACSRPMRPAVTSRSAPRSTTVRKYPSAIST
jgi:hypothetical protein